MSPQELAQLKPQIEYKFWAVPGHPGQTLDDLMIKMEDIGNIVIERDDENQRLLVALMTEEQDRWGCIICFHEGAVIITDSEEELLDHCDESHEGWRNLK
jgi:hypothetical protein